jgi:hypothetical protein
MATTWKGARWIWTHTGGPYNNWHCFRKDFHLEVRPKQARAAIAVDSKYRLWVNGKLIIREGGLRRGPTPTGTYYDELDLAGHLRKGRNVIAVLVWYWGRDGYSHNDSGAAGLLMSLSAGTGPSAVRIGTDSSWRMHRHHAFQAVPETDYRLPEWSIHFDARRDLPGWEQPGFDDADWPAAMEKADPGRGVWGELERRPVPFFRDFGLTRITDPPPARKGVSAVPLPHNMQLAPYIEVDAPAGRTLRITTERSPEGGLDARYTTRKGRQAWESPWWLSGQELRVEVPRDVKVLAIGYRESGAGCEFSGRFRCEDDDLNVLWDKSRRTTYLCLRDNFMDCPDRERGQWWGDAVNEILQGFYGFGSEFGAHARKGMLEIARWQRRDGALMTPMPSGNNRRELPCQMLAGVWIMWQYYEYTGDRKAVGVVYPHVLRYLTEVWGRRMDRRGVAACEGDWIWVDWGEKQDPLRTANALLVIALDSVIAMAELLGRADDLTPLRRMRAKVARAAARHLWTSDVFGPGDRANALAVLAGLVPPEKAESVRDRLLEVEDASPYMERFVEEALFRLGDADAALERMRRRYMPMIRHEYTTLWEAWDLDSLQGLATPNHAWSGGPLYLLGAYAAGIRPLRPGFGRFRVAPQPGGLRRIDCTVPTVRGRIVLALRDQARSLKLKLTCPPRTAAEVGLPDACGPFESIHVDGRRARRLPPDGGRRRGFTWVRVPAGKHEIVAAR